MQVFSIPATSPSKRQLKIVRGSFWEMCAHWLLHFYTSLPYEEERESRFCFLKQGFSLCCTDCFLACWAYEEISTTLTDYFSTFLKDSSNILLCSRKLRAVTFAPIFALTCIHWNNLNKCEIIFLAMYHIILY